MLNIDDMTEETIIKLMQNEPILKEIAQGNIQGFCQGKDQTIELWHLVSRISPSNQDIAETMNLDKISKLIAKRVLPYIKKTDQNDAEKNGEVLDKVYYPLIQLFNKLSIKRAKELSTMPVISKLLINPKINPGITYTAMSRIERPSVLKELKTTMNNEILKNRSEQLENQRTKSILSKIIQQHKDDPAIKEHFQIDYQRTTDKEKYNEDVYNYYKTTRGMIEYFLKNINSESQERANERVIQQNIELMNKYNTFEETPKFTRR